MEGREGRSNRPEPQRIIIVPGVVYVDASSM